MDYMNSLGSLILPRNGRSRSINQENLNGEKGGGKAASNLGPGRKGNPCMSGLSQRTF